MNVLHLTSTREAILSQPPEAEVPTPEPAKSTHWPFSHANTNGAVARWLAKRYPHTPDSTLVSRGVTMAPEDGGTTKDGPKGADAEVRRLKYSLANKAEDKPPFALAPSVPPPPSTHQATSSGNSPTRPLIPRPRPLRASQRTSGTSSTPQVTNSGNSPAHRPSAEQRTPRVSQPGDDANPAHLKPPDTRPGNDPIQALQTLIETLRAAELGHGSPSAQFADALGYRIVDCGGSGNNCMLLSALTARDRLAGQNPPAEGHAATAEKLRQEENLPAIQRDLQNHIFDLKRRLTAIGLSEREIAAIIEKSKSLSERGANPEWDKKDLAEFRAQLLPKVAEWLKMDENSDAVDDEYNGLTEVMGRIGDLNFLYEHSATGQSLYIEAAEYLAQLFGRDIAVVVKSSRASRVYYFQANGLHMQALEGKLGDVLEEWKTQHGTGTLNPIILELSGNDHSGHYRAFVPKASA